MYSQTEAKESRSWIIFYFSSRLSSIKNANMPLYWRLWQGFQWIHLTEASISLATAFICVMNTKILSENVMRSEKTNPRVKIGTKYMIYRWLNLQKNQILSVFQFHMFGIRSFMPFRCFNTKKTRWCRLRCHLNLDA